MSASASKKSKKTVRTATAHLSLEQLNGLARGEKVLINLNDDDLVLVLTSETIKEELEGLFSRVDDTFTDITKSFRKIFGK